LMLNSCVLGYFCHDRKEWRSQHNKEASYAPISSTAQSRFAAQIARAGGFAHGHA
jgi:hypothetical protein